MYGVPADLNLKFLHQAELIQLCLGLYQLQFHFHPAGSISVEGAWELRDAAGVVIDVSHNVPDRPPYQLHRLIGHRVVGYEGICAGVVCSPVRGRGGASNLRRFPAVRVVPHRARRYNCLIETVEPGAHNQLSVLRTSRALRALWGLTDFQFKLKIGLTPRSLLIVCYIGVGSAVRALIEHGW